MILWEKNPLGRIPWRGIFMFPQIYHFPQCQAQAVCVCVCACLPSCILHANTAYVACLNVHVAGNYQAKTSQARGWAACCCALLSTICLCQKYLLCTEWGMKSIQMLFFPPVAPSWRWQKLYWYLPDKPKLSNVTTGRRWHSQTDHLVSGVQ